MAVTPPTARDVRDVSRVPFEDLGWPAVEAPKIDRLQVALDAIVPWIEDLTGYYFSPDGGAEPTQYQLRDRQRPQFAKAIRMAAEFEAFKEQPDNIEDLIDFAEIQAMSAGSYSEERRTVGQTMRAMEIHPWPSLAALLLGLMHPSRRSKGEVPGIGHTDWARPSGDDVMAARFGIGCCFNPFDMRPGGGVFVPNPYRC